VNGDDPAAFSHVGIEVRSILHAHVASISLVDDDDVRVYQLLLGWKVQAAVDDGVPVHQQLAPVGKKLRIVVLPFGVRLQSGIEIDANGRCGEWARLNATPSASTAWLLLAGRRRCWRLLGDDGRTRNDECGNK
jgi:hypothetical protein